MTSGIRTRFLAAIVLILAAMLFSPDLGRAQSSAAAALTGRISSQEEGTMEGVLVTVRKEGSPFTITVASDRQGRYSFPQNRLEPGLYSLNIRAVGYEIDLVKVEVAAEKAATADLKLRRTKDLAAQLTDAEWFLSWPGAREAKMPFFRDPTYKHFNGCHTIEEMARSRYTPDGFDTVLQRGAGCDDSAVPPARDDAAATRQDAGGTTRRNVTDETREPFTRKDSEYLSTINLSKVSKWEYSLKMLPRPAGRATRMVVTEYDLPRAGAQPHDVVMAPDGMIWYADFGKQFIGKLDPKTAKVVEYTVPTIRPGHNTGMNNYQVDEQGNLWIAMFAQAGLAKFDPKTEKFQVWGLPKELQSSVRRTVFVEARYNAVDGKVWLGGGQEGQNFRVDLKSGNWEVFDEKSHLLDLPKGARAASRPHASYSISSDSKNNLYLLDIASEYIIKVDAKTLKATYYETPTFNSRVRRGNMDPQDRLWFAEHGANKIGMFDTKTERFQEWELPTPFSNPYDAILDKNGDVWTGGMTSDRIARLNPKTGEITSYLMPQNTNVRRVFVDNSTTPVTFWVGNNNKASIVKVEPLD
ncbi:MAG: hypothetical protein A3J28_02060 [Acidobacteria bacterium RIFCSPLOWO2_12_FULL_60_22]|nr:MAG: hypothetical protein A3J28_02060 [Acidobacteria bacterium RIFCSPLOWO2_12_FULL_60_22]